MGEMSGRHGGDIGQIYGRYTGDSCACASCRLASPRKGPRSPTPSEMMLDGLISRAPRVTCLGLGIGVGVGVGVGVGLGLGAGAGAGVIAWAEVIVEAELMGRAAGGARDLVAQLRVREVPPGVAEEGAAIADALRDVRGGVKGEGEG